MATMARKYKLSTVLHIKHSLAAQSIPSPALHNKHTVKARNFTVEARELTVKLKKVTAKVRNICMYVFFISDSSCTGTKCKGI